MSGLLIFTDLLNLIIYITKITCHVLCMYVRVMSCNKYIFPFQPLIRATNAITEY